MTTDQGSLPEVDIEALGVPVRAPELPSAEGVLANSEAAAQETNSDPVIPVERMGVVFDYPDNYYRAGMGDMADEDWERFLHLPPVGYQTAIERLDPVLEQMAKTAAPGAEQDWANELANSVRLYERENLHQATIDREGAEWYSYIETPEKRLGPIRSGVGSIRGGQSISGIKAIVKATAYTTAGAVVRVPLPHTGIWVTIKAPNDGALIELERRIAMDRAEFGRLTGARVFSQSDVILKSQLIALLVEHIVDSTYPDPSKDLREVILLTDLSIALTWLALSIYPDSFPLSQPCVADPKACKHIERGQVNIAKMVRYDNNRITEVQRRFIARFQTACNLEELKAYQDGFAAQVRNVHDYKGQVRFTFRTPTLLEYLEMGTAWVQGLESSVDEAFGAKVSVSERNALIHTRAEATALRQYGHWVERITYLNSQGEADAVVDTEEAIFETLEVFSSDDRIAKSFFGGVTDYINAVTVAICAIPNFSCPSCKRKQPDEGAAFKHLIPIDASTVFFTILSHRVLSVVRRNGI